MNLNFLMIVKVILRYDKDMSFVLQSYFGLVASCIKLSVQVFDGFLELNCTAFFMLLKRVPILLNVHLHLMIVGDWVI